MSAIGGYRNPPGRAEAKIWNSHGCREQLRPLIPVGGGSGEGKKDLVDRLSGGRGDCLAPGRKLSWRSEVMGSNHTFLNNY